MERLSKYNEWCKKDRLTEDDVLEYFHKYKDDKYKDIRDGNMEKL